MRISFGSRIEKLETINNANGYGYATERILESLRRLGYHVEANDATADVEIWFDQPHHWKFSPNTYKIGYHPWESTLLQDGWAEKMNECDEIWTPSPLIADWYRRYAGVTVPIYVYEHGLDHVWSPAKRVVDGPVRLLHVGSEASRKGGWDTVTLFRQAFQHRQDVSLTLKMIKQDWLGFKKLGRVTYLNEKYDFPKLQNLFYDHHIYVYPSFGEGFGLTPLQALGTGMPTITLPGWAPYAEFLDPNLSVSHEMVDTPWPKIHPGQMMQPSRDDIIDAMRYGVDNYEKASQRAYDTAGAVHEKYDWDSLTAETFSALEKRLK